MVSHKNHDICSSLIKTTYLNFARLRAFERPFEGRVAGNGN